MSLGHLAHDRQAQAAIESGGNQTLSVGHFETAMISAVSEPFLALLLFGSKSLLRVCSWPAPAMGHSPTTCTPKIDKVSPSGTDPPFNHS